MVTWIQLTSLLLLCLLSELDFSSAFPRARGSVYPEAWPGFEQEQQVKGFNSGIRRPLQHIQALRRPHRRLQSNVHGHVPGKAWQQPQGTSLYQPQSQNQSSLYRQTQNQKHSSLSQTPLTRPRSFEFNLKVPFASSTSPPAQPTSVQLHTSFNHPSGSDAQWVKGSTNDPHGVKNVDQVSK
ncbi:hypothetical protein INR49_005103, partial [Caranx melampygus]